MYLLCETINMSSEHVLGHKLAYKHDHILHKESISTIAMLVHVLLQASQYVMATYKLHVHCTFTVGAQIYNYAKLCYLPLCVCATSQVRLPKYLIFSGFMACPYSQWLP